MDPINHTPKDLTPRDCYVDFEFASVPTKKGAPYRCIKQIGAYDPKRERGKQIFNAFVEVPSLLQQGAVSPPSFTENDQGKKSYPFSVVYPQLVRFINSGLDGHRQAVIVMHNGFELDWGVLQTECLRIGEQIPPFWIPFDSFRLANYLKIPGDRSLSGLCHRYGVQVLKTHDAADDAVMLGNVFPKMLGGMPLEEALRKVPGTPRAIPAVASAIKSHKMAVLVFFDFETTGLYPKEHETFPKPRVTEVGVHIPSIGASFSSLVKPGIPIPNKVKKITGIKNRDVKNAPRFKEVWQKVEEFIKNHIDLEKYDVCLAGHNIIGFDIKVYNAECERVGLKKKWYKLLDTFRMTRSVFKGRQLPCAKLQYLRKVFNIAENQAHRAMGDVMVNVEVFRHFVKGLDQEWIQKALKSVAPAATLATFINDHGDFNPEDYKDAPPYIKEPEPTDSDVDDSDYDYDYDEGYAPLPRKPSTKKLSLDEDDLPISKRPFVSRAALAAAYNSDDDDTEEYQPKKKQKATLPPASHFPSSHPSPLSSRAALAAAYNSDDDDTEEYQPKIKRKATLPPASHSPSSHPPPPSIDQDIILSSDDSDVEWEMERKKPRGRLKRQPPSVQEEVKKPKVKVIYSDSE